MVGSSTELLIRVTEVRFFPRALIYQLLRIKMKNKPQQKSKPKKPSPKKEIKRPAHKKPRPKKYVEAKIPTLPPVPTTALEITRDKTTKPVPVKTITIELPDGQTEGMLTKAILSATEQLKILADEIFKDAPAAHEASRAEREPPNMQTIYHDPGVGVIKRHFETIPDIVHGSAKHIEQSELFAKMLNEEKSKDRAPMEYVVIKDGWHKGRIITKHPEHTPEKPVKQNIFKWLLGLFK